MEKELMELETTIETCENIVEENNLQVTLLLTTDQNDQEEDDDDDVLLLSNHNNQFTVIKKCSILAKNRFLISCIIILLVVILLLISIIIRNSSSHSESQSSTITISDMTTTRATIMLTQSSTITISDMTTTRATIMLTQSSTKTLTFSPKSCPISSVNATWSNSAIVFVNRINRCLSNENSLCSPGDLFIDNIHDTLYIADTNNNRIQKYSLTEIYDTEVGAIGITVASKNLISPQSIFVDIHTENMYILDLDHKDARRLQDSVSYRVHLWKKNEKVGRILFSEAGEYLFGEFNHHLTLDKQMNIYVGTRYFIKKWLVAADYMERVIVAGKSEYNHTQSTNLWDPVGFFITDDLTLYIADWQNKRIQQWKINATEGTTVIENLLYVIGLTMDCNGYVYFIDTYEYTISQLNLVTNQTRIIGGFQDDIKRTIFHVPRAIKIDKFGNLFLLDDSRIYKFSATKYMIS